MTDSSQHIGDAATGVTAGAGVIHVVTENATFISITVMVMSAVIAVVFHTLNYFTKRRELDLLREGQREQVIKDLMDQLSDEQSRAVLKKAARAIKGGG